MAKGRGEWRTEAWEGRWCESDLKPRRTAAARVRDEPSVTSLCGIYEKVGVEHGPINLPIATPGDSTICLLSTLYDPTMLLVLVFTP